MTLSVALLQFCKSERLDRLAFSVYILGPLLANSRGRSELVEFDGVAKLERRRVERPYTLGTSRASL